MKRDKKCSTRKLDRLCVVRNKASTEQSGRIRMVEDKAQAYPGVGGGEKAATDAPGPAPDKCLPVGRTKPDKNFKQMKSSRRKIEFCKKKI